MGIWGYPQCDKPMSKNIERCAMVCHGQRKSTHRNPAAKIRLPAATRRPLSPPSRPTVRASLHRLTMAVWGWWERGFKLIADPAHTHTQTYTNLIVFPWKQHSVFFCCSQVPMHSMYFDANSLRFTLPFGKSRKPFSELMKKASIDRSTCKGKRLHKQNFQVPGPCKHHI